MVFNKCLKYLIALRLARNSCRICVVQRVRMMISINSNADSSLQAPRWWNELKILDPHWRLVPCDGAKCPIDPLTGRPQRDWGGKSLSPSEFHGLLRSGIKAAGLVLGPVSNGVLAVDFDADGYQEKFEQAFGRPLAELPCTVAWTSGKPGRRQLAYAVPQGYWDNLRGKKAWNNKQEKTCLELRWKGHQSVILGAHPETNGYHWCEGCSPREMKVAIAPHWLLEPLLKTDNQNALPSHAATEDPEKCRRAREILKLVSPRDAYKEWLNVGMILREADESLLGDWIDWSRQTNYFDEAECIAKWNSFNGSGLTLGTLYHMAMQDTGKPLSLNRETIIDLPQNSNDEGLSVEDSLSELIRLYSQGRIDAQKLLPPYLRDALSVVRETISYDWSVLLLVLCVGISGALPLDSGIELIPGDFEQSLNLFAVLLMDTGEAKSPLIKRLISTPWKKSVDVVMKARYIDALRQWKLLKESSKDTNDQVELPRPDQAATLIHEDLTPQGVERHLVLHDRFSKGSILLLIDEAKDMLSEMTGQSASSNHLKLGSWILSRYDGSGARGAKADAAYERHYSQCRVSALFCCQPDIYREIAGDSDQSGLAGRFVAVEQTTVDQHFPDEFDCSHQDRHKRLSDLLVELYMFVCERNSLRLVLDSDARRLFQQERRFLNDRKNKTLNDAERGQLNKSHGRIGRLAGVLHVIWSFQDSRPDARAIPPVVSIAAMQMAIELNRFLLSQSVLARETSDGNNLSMKKILAFHARARKVIEPRLVTSIRKALASPMRATPAETELIARSLHQIGVGRVTKDHKGRLCYQAIKHLGA